MMMWVFLVILGVLTYLLYLYVFSKGDQWKKYGIRQIDATGAVTEADILSGKKDTTERDHHAYNLLGPDDKFCGMVEGHEKIFLVKDLDLVKRVLIKDFDHFMDRRDLFGGAQKDSVFLKMMGNMKGERWKEVRSVLTPAFTPGKIRAMMDYSNSVGMEWAQMLTQKAKESGQGFVKIDLLNVVNQYLVDTVASAVFGINGGTVRDPKSVFGTMAQRLGSFRLRMLTLNFRFPTLFRLLRLNFLDMEALSFFERLLEQGFRERSKGGGPRRNDFLQLLLDLKNGQLKGVVEEQMSEVEKDAELQGGKKGRNNNNVVLTDDVLNAQIVSFFFAGVTTTSNFITFALYALALHPEIQDKLRAEVGRLVRGDGSLDYDELGRAEYLDMVACEIMRIYPGALRLERVCLKEYKDPESGIHVPQGALLGIPIKSIQSDSRYFPNPDQFDPDANFSQEAKAGRNPYSFMPFGSGPRNCIGMRFAVINSKSAIVRIVHNFLIEPTDKTPIPMLAIPGNMQLFPPTGLELKLTPIKKGI